MKKLVNESLNTPETNEGEQDVKRKQFVDDFLDVIYLNGNKDDGVYTLRLNEAENAARELYDIYFK